MSDDYDATVQGDQTTGVPAFGTEHMCAVIVLAALAALIGIRYLFTGGLAA